MSSDVDHVSGAEIAAGAGPTGDDRSGREQRKPYHAPSLVVYGSVRELTLGGVGVSSDAVGRVNTKPKKVSDPSVKQNAVRIGTHPLGIGLYLFEYKRDFLNDRRRHFGVMADEVERVMPEAVSRDENGIRQVDHALLGICDFAQQLGD